MINIAQKKFIYIYIYIYIYTVIAKNIGTLGKYDQFCEYESA